MLQHYSPGILYLHLSSIYNRAFVYILRGIIYTCVRLYGFNAAISLLAPVSEGFTKQGPMFSERIPAARVRKI